MALSFPDFFDPIARLSGGFVLLRALSSFLFRWLSRSFWKLLNSLAYVPAYKRILSESLLIALASGTPYFALPNWISHQIATSSSPNIRAARSSF